MMQHYYQLLLGSMRLAPISSIFIDESGDFESLANGDAASAANAGGCASGSSSSGCSSLTSERTFNFKIHFKGNGSLANAWARYSTLLAQLDQACSGSLVLLRRQVQDEPMLIYAVQSRSTARMIDVVNQYTCERILTIELALALKATSSLNNGLVITGTQSAPVYTVTPAPIPMNIGYPTGIISLTVNATPSPIAVAIGYPTPSISMAIAGVAPVALAAAVQVFVRDLGGVDVTTPTGGFVYLPAKQKLLTGAIDLDTDDIRAALLSTNTTADTETDKEFMNLFTTLDEFNGAGYARVALTSEAVNQDAGNNRAEFDAADTAWAALSNGTRLIQGCLLYKHVTNDADSIPIFYMPYTAFNPGGSVLTNEWGAEGIAWLS